MDLRGPIGVLFLILGSLLIVYGLMTGDAPRSDPGFNVNLWWGLGMSLFGGLMTGTARRTRRRNLETKSESLDAGFDKSERN